MAEGTDDMGFMKNLAIAMQERGISRTRAMVSAVRIQSARPKESVVNATIHETAVKSEKKVPKVQLLHRRNRDTAMNREFDTEKEALQYAKEHKLMIVHEERDSDGHATKLHYLPE